jgi:heme-degrading monooxygenase HmoA
MVHVLIHHKVSDYIRWKEAFDAHLNARKKAGEVGFRLFHTIEDPRDVVILSDWQTADEAQKFMKSNELRDVMQKAGVMGDPVIQYLEDARSVHRTSAD